MNKDFRRKKDKHAIILELKRKENGIKKRDWKPKTTGGIEPTSTFGESMKAVMLDVSLTHEAI